MEKVKFLDSLLILEFGISHFFWIQEKSKILRILLFIYIDSASVINNNGMHFIYKLRAILRFFSTFYFLSSFHFKLNNSHFALLYRRYNQA